MTSPPNPTALRVVVSGSSGLIGQALTRSLGANGHHVSRLVRRWAQPGEILWDPASGRLDAARLEGVDAVIHLAGENVGRRWTQGARARIRESRIQGTRLLSETLARLQRPPSVLVSASAIGIYGDRGDEVLDELSPPGSAAGDFLVSVCLEWEAASEAARAAGIRVVAARFGVVLSRRGGALRKQLLPFRLGLGGRLGPGSQWLSWISIHDVVQAVRHLISNPALEGPVNVTAPSPVTNREFTATLARVLGRPALFPIPAGALRLVLGEMANRTLLSSARVLPRKLTESGYRFRHPDLEHALREVLETEQGSNFPA